jgi:hypothetical protein
LPAAVARVSGVGVTGPASSSSSPFVAVIIVVDPP